MKRWFLFILTVFAVGVFGCKTEQGSTSKHSEAQISEQETIYKEVMSVHDAVMPKVSDIARVAQDLRAFIPNEKVDESLKEEIFQTVQQLVIAEEEMMGWMNYFNQPAALRDTSSHEAVMSYLRTEKDKITEVKNKMETSLSNGETLLQKLKAL